MEVEAGSMDREFQHKMAIVIEALKQAGYVPYDQLTGFVRTNNLSYITRNNHARDIVSGMDPEMIRRYLQHSSNPR